MMAVKQFHEKDQPPIHENRKPKIILTFICVNVSESSCGQFCSTRNGLHSPSSWSMLSKSRRSADLDFILALLSMITPFIEIFDTGMISIISDV
jgi:hypothetical protein